MRKACNGEPCICREKADDIFTTSKEQEEQQAQIIAGIDERLKNPWVYDIGTFVNDCEILREIVDSKAQKIAELTETIESENASKELAQSELQTSLKKVAELEKEVARLREEVATHICSLNNNGW